ncbi:MAG: hypothetical protein HQ521_18185 [Bacteroidetes bacterium]|nr:hypothetical protein [Bacteroidota bacterium]
MKFLPIFIIVTSFVINNPFLGACTLLDTIPPPPENPISISGPTQSCVDTTSIYTSDIPLSCNALWYVDGVLQSSTTGTLEITWSASGNFNVMLEFECDTVISSACTILVDVVEFPDQPTPIQGDDNICIDTTSNYTTVVGEGDICQWIVDGIIQISDSTTMSYYWSELGMHNIEVRAMNECGIGDATYLNVIVSELPEVDLGDDITIYEGNSVVLDAGNPGCSYLWSTGDTTQTIVVIQSGNYEVIVSNVCGSVSDDVVVEVIVGIEELSKENIHIKIDGNFVRFEIPGVTIKQVLIFDIAGRIITEYGNETQYFLPEKSIYFIRIATSNNRIVSFKVVK